MKQLFYIIFLTAFFLPVDSIAQKLPPPPKPKASSHPPPPKVGDSGNGGGGGAGFRSVTIPVYGDYQLGLLRREFDSIRSLGEVIFSTDKKEYPVHFSPSYIGSRVYQLIMEFDDSIYQAAPVDIILNYRNKYGDPDSASTGESTYLVASAEDPGKKEALKSKTTYMKWNFRNFDLIILTVFADAKNGGLLGRVQVIFRGNNNYFTMLKELEQKEQD